MAGTEPDWSRISRDLLFSIVKLLPTRIDILRLRAVCHSFRATIPPPPIHYPFPPSILATPDFLKGPYPDEEDLYEFTVSTVYAIEPLNKTSHTHKEETPQTWVVRVQEQNPELIVVKLTFSESLNGNDDEFTVMARDNDKKELGIWRNLDKKWSIIDMERQFTGVLVDIIYHNHRFYAVLPTGHTVIVDPKSLVVTRVAEELQLDWKNWMPYSLYLIELNNDLFLIVQFLVQFLEYDGVDYIALFKLNEENQKWVPVVDGLELEDIVLFVGEDSFAYSFSIKEVAGCVYYAGNGLTPNYPGQDTWICDYKDHVVGDLSDFPGYLNLFWPPPAWLKQEVTASAGEKRRRGSRDDCEETSQA